MKKHPHTVAKNVTNDLDFGVNEQILWETVVFWKQGDRK